MRWLSLLGGDMKSSSCRVAGYMLLPVRMPCSDKLDG